MRCVVLGAGIAGLVAAEALARRGCRVTVVEAGPVAGGRASSWRTASGLAVGTGLHVVAEHYRNLREVIGRLGGADRIVWWDRFRYRRAGGESLEFRLSRLPAPLHLWHPARALPLPLRSRWRLLSAAWSLAGRSPGELDALDRVSYLDWHRSRGLDETFLLDLADFAADATTFLPVDQVSARTLILWLGRMFRSRRAARVGTWRGTAADVLVEPLVAGVRARGGEVRMRTAATHLTDDGRRLTGVVIRPTTLDRPCYGADGGPAVTGREERLTCDAVVSALPVQGLRRLLDDRQIAWAGLGPALRLTTVPALTAVLAFDREIGLPPGVLLESGSPIRNAVDVTDWRGAGGGSVVEVLVSRAEERLALDDGEIVRQVLDALRGMAPRARGAELVEAHVERVEAAMFAARPGADRLRPGARTGVANLLLAGDWVHRGWNASMEGAAASGRLAAVEAWAELAGPAAGRPSPDSVAR